MPRGRSVNGSGMQPRKRADGRWECRYQTGIDLGTGRAILKSVYGKTAEECARICSPKRCSDQGDRRPILSQLWSILLFVNAPKDCIWCSRKILHIVLIAIKGFNVKGEKCEG